MVSAQMCETGKDAGRWFSLARAPGGVEYRVGYCARGCPGHDSGAAALTQRFYRVRLVLPQ